MDCSQEGQVDAARHSSLGDVFKKATHEMKDARAKRLGRILLPFPSHLLASSHLASDHTTIYSLPSIYPTISYPKPSSYPTVPSPPLSSPSFPFSRLPSPPLYSPGFKSSPPVITTSFPPPLHQAASQLPIRLLPPPAPPASASDPTPRLTSTLALAPSSSLPFPPLPPPLILTLPSSPPFPPPLRLDAFRG